MNAEILPVTSRTEHLDSDGELEYYLQHESISKNSENELDTLESIVSSTHDEIMNHQKRLWDSRYDVTDEEYEAFLENEDAVESEHSGPMKPRNIPEEDRRETKRNFHQRLSIKVPDELASESTAPQKKPLKPSSRGIVTSAFHAVPSRESQKSSSSSGKLSFSPVTRRPISPLTSSDEAPASYRQRVGGQSNTSKGGPGGKQRPTTAPTAPPPSKKITPKSVFKGLVSGISIIIPKSKKGEESSQPLANTSASFQNFAKPSIVPQTAPVISSNENRLVAQRVVRRRSLNDMEFQEKYKAREDTEAALKLRRGGSFDERRKAGWEEKDRLMRSKSFDGRAGEGSGGRRVGKEGGGGRMWGESGSFSGRESSRGSWSPQRKKGEGEKAKGWDKKKKTKKKGSDKERKKTSPGALEPSNYPKILDLVSSKSSENSPAGEMYPKIWEMVNSNPGSGKGQEIMELSPRSPRNPSIAPRSARNPVVVPTTFSNPNFVGGSGPLIVRTPLGEEGDDVDVEVNVPRDRTLRPTSSLPVATAVTVPLAAARRSRIPVASVLESGKGRKAAEGSGTLSRGDTGDAPGAPSRSAEQNVLEAEQRGGREERKVGEEEGEGGDLKRDSAASGESFATALETTSMHRRNQDVSFLESSSSWDLSGFVEVDTVEKEGEEGAGRAGEGEGEEEKEEGKEVEVAEERKVDGKADEGVAEAVEDATVEAVAEEEEAAEVATIGSVAEVVVEGGTAAVAAKEEATGVETKDEAEQAKEEAEVGFEEVITDEASEEAYEASSSSSSTSSEGPEKRANESLFQSRAAAGNSSKEEEASTPFPLPPSSPPPLSPATSPSSFVLVHNVAKRHNVGTLVRSCVAFGVQSVILIGRQRGYNAFGSHGAAEHMDFRHFYTLLEAREWLKEKGVEICGVEITDNAESVAAHPFKGSTAFLIGNEGSGLSEKEMEICDSFVYIPQYGAGTASLNVTVAASIVLHNFAVWAGFQEQQREGQKFIIKERPVRRTARNMCPEDPAELAERRRQKAELANKDWLAESSSQNLGSLGDSYEVPNQETSVMGSLFAGDD